MAPLTITENPLALEPVTADPFVDDLEPGSFELTARVAQLAARAAASPHRRIFD